MVWLVGLAVVVFLAYKFPRQAKLIVVLALLTAGLVVTAAWYQGDGPPVADSLVTARTSFGTSECADPQYPISVAFTNGAERAVEYVTFEVRGVREGYSQPRYASKESWDRIMQPGETYASCWAVSRNQSDDLDVDGLKWQVEVDEVRFQ